MTSLEDERLTAGDEHEVSTSGILTAEIERPRVGPMRDIVATIAPDQDSLVRAPLEQTMCVQGAPGTGKTAVGLHRAAYLLYTHREQLRRTRVLVVGPNRSFLSYIGALLPALGEIDVQQVVVDDLVAGVTVRGHDAPDVARLKGDARLADRHRARRPCRHPGADRTAGRVRSGRVAGGCRRRSSPTSSSASARPANRTA